MANELYTQLQEILHTKEGIKNAINSIPGNEAHRVGDNFSTYADALTSAVIDLQSTSNESSEYISKCEELAKTIIG